MAKRNRWLVEGNDQNTKEMMVFFSRGECIVEAPGRETRRFYTDGDPSVKKDSLRVVDMEGNAHVFQVLKDPKQLRKESLEAHAKVEKAREREENKRKQKHDDEVEKLLGDE